VKLLGEVRLDGGNYQEIACRTPLMRQNRRCRAIAENNFLRNGVILYTHAKFEDHLGNVGLKHFMGHSLRLLFSQFSRATNGAPG
jgi:hypothetical protein